MKSSPKPVRLGVDQRVDELPRPRPETRHPARQQMSPYWRFNSATMFGSGWRHSVRATATSSGAVRADDQDPALLDPPCEVKQQAGRRLVDPVQVVENQDQRTLLRDFDQDRGDLLEHATLVCDRRGIGAGAGCLRPAGRSRDALPALSGDQRRPWSRAPHRAGICQSGRRERLADHVLRDAQEFAQSPRVLARGQIDGHRSSNSPASMPRQLAERQVQVADARLRIARADCNEQVVVPLQRTARELDRQAPSCRTPPHRLRNRPVPVL